jgi:predicted porin
MKKSLIALAALAAVGSVSAQSSVTVFGVIDTSFSINNGSIADVKGLAFGNLSTSRIGFRGIEDIGGGLKAGFWLESEIDSSNGAGNGGTSTNNSATDVAAGSSGLTFGRRATVSLSGSFGEFRFGRDYTPTYHNEAQFASLGRNGAGATLITQVNVVGTTRSRTSNGLQYLLPGNLGGFYGEAMYAFGEQPTNAGIPAGAQEDNGNYYGGRIGYKDGAFDISLSAGQTDSTRSGTVAAGPVAATPAQKNDRQVVNAGVTYDFGVVKLFGLYSVQTQENTVGTLASGLNLATVAFAGRDLEAKAFAIGLTVPFGPGTFKAGYSNLELNNGQGAGTSPKADKFAFGYQYDLSKRTAVYATYARLKNKDAAAGSTLGLTAGANRQRGLSGVAATGANASSDAFDIGIRHNF